MSSLIVEVCEIKEVKPHPNADRLEICVVKGWNVVVPKGQFARSDRCVFIPYDAVIPPELANGPDDDVPGRLNVMKYCAPLHKDGEGNRLPGGRVRAARLRGERSYGIPMAIDPAYGDDPEWEVGQDVADHFGIVKWVPPVECRDGEPEHPRFHTFTDMENINNFPHVLRDGEDVVMTEKVHGKNCRLGMVLNRDEETGEAVWEEMAGSCTFRRKRVSTLCSKFSLENLIEQELLPLHSTVVVGQLFETKRGHRYKVDELWEDGDHFKAIRCDHEGQPKVYKSEFWKFMTDDIKALLAYVRDELEWHEPKAGIVIFGEIYGAGVQDMQYGQEGKSYRGIDIAVNGRYLDYETKTSLFRQFGIEVVPLLYRGPYSDEMRLKATDGDTNLCDTKKAGRFQGREGCVITPTVERFSEELIGRVILKSVSVDYLQRRGATDNKE